MGRRVALLIATYEYEDPALRRLTAPAHDADALAGVLRDPRIAGFEVTMLVNEPHYRVGEAIGDFYRDRRRDDLTLLYFTGHGLKDDEGRLYLAMTNTRRDSLLFTALSAESVDQALESCPSRRKVLILDCCYSGAYPAGRVAKADSQVHTLERFQGRGRTVLTASDATQYSFEGDEAHGQAAQSVFTRYLVAGLRDGSADLDGDGDITIDELYSYAHDRVVEELPQQRPKKQDNVQGRTVIARNVNWDLPAYLRNAIASPIATDRLGALDALGHLHRIGNETVRERVLAEMRRLADDDSRSVSATAARRLAALDAPATPLPAPATSAPAPREPADTPPTPAAPDPVIAAAGPRPVTAAPAPGPGTAPPVTDTAAPGGAAAPGGVTARRKAARSHRDRLALAVGLLAILAGVLMAGGVVLREVVVSGGIRSTGPLSDHPWYTAALAALCVVAGLVALRPAARDLVAPGLVLGVTAASSWGLAAFGGRFVDDLRQGDAFHPPPVEVAGHLVLLAAAVLALLRARRSGRLGLRASLPRDPLALVALALGGLAALATAALLAVEAFEIARLAYPAAGPVGRRLGAYAVAAVLAVNVPLWAAALRPRPFSAALLAGWSPVGWRSA